MKYRFVVICLLSLTLASCVRDDNSLNGKDGEWEDSIKLSKHEIEFEAEKGSQTVVSEGRWWLSYVENLQTSISYPGVGDINTTGNLGTYEWLNIEKIDKKTLQIKVERNAGTMRKMRIVITCGDFFDYIVVTQKGFN